VVLVAEIPTALPGCSAVVQADRSAYAMVRVSVLVKGGHVQTTKADLLKDSSLTKADTRTGLPLGRRSVAKWRRALVTKCTEAKTLAIFVPASVILTTTQRVWHPETHRIP
jgi:hypothetical protein